MPAMHRFPPDITRRRALQTLAGIALSGGAAGLARARLSRGQATVAHAAADAATAADG